MAAASGASVQEAVAAAAAVAVAAPKDASVVVALVQEIIVNSPVLALVVVMDHLDLVVTEVNEKIDEIGTNTNRILILKNWWCK